MTVLELIDHLYTLNPNSSVYVPAISPNGVEFVEVELEHIDSFVFNEEVEGAPSIAHDGVFIDFDSLLIKQS